MTNQLPRAVHMWRLCVRWMASGYAVATAINIPLHAIYGYILSPSTVILS